MITIANPNSPKAISLKGKIILQYHNRDQHLDKIKNKTWLQEVEFAEFPNIDYGEKSFGLKFKDFFDRDLILSLSTKQILWFDIETNDNGPRWRKDENGKILKNEILWDNNNLFLIGKFKPTYPLQLNNNLIEEYMYFVTIEFVDRKDDILNFLNKERLNGDIANDIKMPL